MLDPAAMLRQIAAVTRARGLRALVGAGWTDYGDAQELPDHVFLAPAFDHDAVLPRCQAAVHHGGAGTTGSALRAGLPSLVVSVFADQPYWGWRVTESGVGATIPYPRLDERALGEGLDRVLGRAVEQRADEMGALLRAERGTDNAADAIEQWLSPSSHATAG